MTNGLVVMTPTTVDKTGGSSTATINADGSVTFGSCETLSLNGVFTSDYDNYMIVMRLTSSAAGDILFRLRASGTDDATSSSYVNQFLRVDGASISGFRFSTQAFYPGEDLVTQRTGRTIYVFGPYLAQPTALRSVTSLDRSSSNIEDVAATHNQSTAYDGFTIDPASTTNTTGLLTVFGFNQ